MSLRLGSLRKDSTGDAVAPEAEEMVFDVTAWSHDVVETKRGPAVMRQLDPRRLGPAVVHFTETQHDESLLQVPYDVEVETGLGGRHYVQAWCLHNFWVASKVYGWHNHPVPACCSIPAHMRPNERYFLHRARMLAKEEPLLRSTAHGTERYEKKREEGTHKHPPVYRWFGGEKMTRVEARFRVLAPLYAEMVTSTRAYRALQALLRRGKKVLLMGRSGFTMERSVVEHMMDDTAPCKHDVFLYALLRGERPWENRFPGPMRAELRFVPLREVPRPAKKRVRAEDAGKQNAKK